MITAFFGGKYLLDMDREKNDVSFVNLTGLGKKFNPIIYKQKGTHANWKTEIFLLKLRTTAFGNTGINHSYL